MRTGLLVRPVLGAPRAALLALASALMVAAMALAFMASPARAATTFMVNSTADTVDANTSDGNCADANGKCTLRAAIQQANALSGADTINVPAGAYKLTISGREEDAAATGDLDVTDELTITGAGAGSTTIDGNGIDRVFEDRPGTKLTISGVTIQGGDPGGGFVVGGGVAVDGSASLTLNDSVITNNKNTAFGGGLSNGGSATLNNDTISDNTVTFSGGGIDNASSATLNVTNSTVSGNTATEFGGGLNNEGGTVTLVNDTFSGNTAGNGSNTGGGGGISSGFSSGMFSGGTVTLTNVTLNKNTIKAGSSGGGILVLGGNTATFKNSIVANSTGGTDCSSAQGNASTGTLTSQGNNLSTDASCNFTQSTDKPNTDPKLGPLQNNGGPTQTHALLTGSPAIDAGTNTGCPSTDQRGVTRPQDGDNNGSAICDIGAFEVAATPPPSPPPPPGATPPPPPSSGHHHKHKGGHHHKKKHHHGGKKHHGSNGRGGS